MHEVQAIRLVQVKQLTGQSIHALPVTFKNVDSTGQVATHAAWYNGNPASQIKQLVVLLQVIQ
jgi:hypothetical protein